MDLTKAVKEKYKKPLTSCTNKEIYICLLEQVKKLAKEKEAAGIPVFFAGLAQEA